MNPLRSLLVHVDGSPRNPARLELALRLAAANGARLTALFAALPPLATIPYGYVAEAMPLALLEKLFTEVRDGARAQYDRAVAGTGVRAQWIELGDTALYSGVAAHALTADLLVLGQFDPSQRSAQQVPPDFVESVLIESGRPALVVPYAGRFDTVGRRVLVAWKASRESARAVSSALPLLAAADAVHVVAWTEGGARPGQTAAALADFLDAHGIRPKTLDEGAVPGEVGELLLSRAADVDADLLVMGCYGHSRAREFMLGGATRTVLQSMTVPVLMSH